MSQYKRHKKNWSTCQLCELCKKREKVVLFRGKRIPVDVLFVGEAPGSSEDVLGQPFVGPAGKLLDQMIWDSKLGQTCTVGFTNLVACIPLEQQPDPVHIKACGDRLREIYTIAKPRVVVLVGKLAETWFPKIILLHPKTLRGAKVVGIIHPAAILRDRAQKGIAIQRTIIRLRNLAEELA